MMTELLNLVHHYGNLFFGSLWPVVWIMIRIGIILAPILGIVTFLTLGERESDRLCMRVLGRIG